MCWRGGLFLPGCTTWHFPWFVELREATVSLFLQSVKLHLMAVQPPGSSPALHHFQTQHTLCPIIQVINEDVKQYWTPGVHHQRLAYIWNTCC